MENFAFDTKFSMQNKDKMVGRFCLKITNPEKAAKQQEAAQQPAAEAGAEVLAPAGDAADCSTSR